MCKVQGFRSGKTIEIRDVNIWKFMKGLKLSQNRRFARNSWFEGGPRMRRRRDYQNLMNSGAALWFYIRRDG